MYRTQLPALVLALVGVVACAPTRGPVGDRAAAVSRADGGAFFLYVQPLPPDADRLRVEIESVVAIPLEAGPAVPLTLASGVLDGGAPRRQRLLASADLPAGRYRGISIRVAEAILVGGQGEGALTLPQQPRVLEVPFTITRGSASVRTLRLQMGASVTEGYAFDPVFTAAPPGELAPEATAVATVADSAVLAVFHKISGEVFDVLRTARQPTATAYDSFRRRAYVAGAAEDVVEVFDLDRGTREQSFPLLLGDRPSALGLTRDGRTLATANLGSGTVAVLDAPVLSERFRILVGPEPVALIVAPDDRTAIVVSRGADSVSVIDLLVGSVRGQVAVEDSPVFGAFNARGDRLLVIHSGSPNIVAVDVGTLRVTQRAYVGVGAAAIAIDPRTDRIYLARDGTGQIEVFDPSSLLPIDSFDTAGDVSFLQVGPENDQLYAATTGEIRFIRLVDGKTAAVVELGADPGWIDVAGAR